MGEGEKREKEKENSPQSPSLFSSSLYPLPLSTPATQAGNKLSNVRSFIILLSGEGLTSFSVNNRIYALTFLVKKKSKLRVSGVSFFKTTHKNSFSSSNLKLSNCGTHFGSSSRFSFLKWRIDLQPNSYTSLFKYACSNN